MSEGVKQADPTKRFSNRVENYLRFRPNYPKQILDFLKVDCRLTADSIVADIGSGTGFLAELFLANGNRVSGIEPNKEMREAGERLLKPYPLFTSIAATAEETTLPANSVDFVTAGQAFHWFDRARCRKEFGRILRPGGWVVLVWNDRHTDTTPFLRDYEQLLLTCSTDYAQVNHKNVDAAVLHDFFQSDPTERSVPNFQHFDFPSLTGRLLSSSYVPAAGEPGYDKMLVELKKLFDSHQLDGRVMFEYDTRMFYRRLG